MATEYGIAWMHKDACGYILWCDLLARHVERIADELAVGIVEAAKPIPEIIVSKLHRGTQLNNDHHFHFCIRHISEEFILVQWVEHTQAEFSSIISASESAHPLKSNANEWISEGQLIDLSMLHEDTHWEHSLFLCFCVNFVSVRLTFRALENWFSLQRHPMMCAACTSTYGTIRDLLSLLRCAGTTANSAKEQIQTGQRCFSTVKANSVREAVYNGDGKLFAVGIHCEIFIVMFGPMYRSTIHELIRAVKLSILNK